MGRTFAFAFAIATTAIGITQLRCGGVKQEAKNEASDDPVDMDSGDYAPGEENQKAETPSRADGTNETSPAEIPQMAEARPKEIEQGGFAPVADYGEKKEPPLPTARRAAPTLNVLVTHLKSPSATVRQTAVRKMAGVSSFQAIAILEEVMIRDKSRIVRLAAMESLLARRSRSSLKAMQRAMQAATTSAERAELKKAIGILRGL